MQDCTSIHTARNCRKTNNLFLAHKYDEALRLLVEPYTQGLGDGAQPGELVVLMMVFCYGGMVGMKNRWMHQSRVALKPTKHTHVCSQGAKGLNSLCGKSNERTNPQLLPHESHVAIV